MTDITVLSLDAAKSQDRSAFVDLGRRFSAQVPHFVPQMRSEQIELVHPDKNPFFQHADVQLFIAQRGGKPWAGSARISITLR